MRTSASTLGLLLVMGLIASCEEPAEQQKPLPEVFYIETSEKPYKPERSFNGRIESKTDVNISAEVSGKLTAIHFNEGDQIEADTLLFEIDPAPYRAALARAEAELAKAKAAQANATKNFERGKKLVKDGYISGSEYDTLEAKKLETAAAVESAQAAVTSAQVDLEYTSIKAPQAGRVGRAKPSVGDVVSPGYGPLTTLVGKEGMEVVFQVPEKVLIATQRREGKVPTQDIDVVIIMPDGSTYPHHGVINYISNRVDATTGTIEVRASVPNPGEALRPGLYVQALLSLKQPLQGLLIPQATIQVDQQGTYVFAVDEESKITRLNITTGDRFGENVLVESGLEVGTKVVIRGVQKARPGDEVSALKYQPATKPSEASETGLEKGSDQE